MELSTIIGLVLGLVSVFVGMVLKGAGLEVLVNPAAILIIIFGTLAALFVAFPLNQIKKLIPLFKIVLLGNIQKDSAEYINELVNYCKLVRKSGFLALEEGLNDIKDPFLKKGLMLIVDGTDPDQLRKIMETEIESLEERHRIGASIFSQAGMYAPTLGVLGAVVGLIAALGNLNDIGKLGHSIAAAFVATLLGIFTGYVMWHPMSNKLKVLSKVEVESKTMILEGLHGIQMGLSPNLIEELLLSYVSSTEKQHYFKLKEKPNNE